MSISYIKTSFLKTLAVAGILLGGVSCEIEDIPDPNNPGISLVENAALSEIQNLVSGTEAGMRNRLGTYIDNVSTRRSSTGVIRGSNR